MRNTIAWTIANGEAAVIALEPEEQILSELAAHGASYQSYASLRKTLNKILVGHVKELPAQYDPVDVLVWGTRRGWIVFDGDEARIAAPARLEKAMEASVHPIKREFDEAYGLVEGKAHDYAELDNVFSNFEFAAQAAGITVEQVFLTLIGIKSARLKQLITNEKEPNYEGIDDTLLDLMNYSGLLKAYRRENREH